MARRDAEQIVARIREAVSAGSFRLTRHAHEEMVEENIALSDVAETVANAVLLEDYPEHRRGACCPISGWTATRRPLHVVCTTDSPLVIVITVYEPRPPKWSAPSRQGGRR
ncbi:MAG: DUF4258 domain-containing protein [Candidatus Rokuibacteriota bacterium]